MHDAYQTYEQMKGFLAFDDDDARRLVALAPLFRARGPAITDAFYASLGQMDATAALIEGRVDALKRTHIAWMGTLFEGAYDRPFFERQYQIGRVHVAAGVLPAFVQGVTTTLRLGGASAIAEELGDTPEAHRSLDSLVKVLDLCLLTINLAYEEERLQRLTSVTGMRRTLLDNLVKQGRSRG